MNDTQHKVAAAISAALTLLLLIAFAIHTRYDAGAALGNDVTFAVETEVRESGTHDLTFGEEKTKAENALWHQGQQMFLDTTLRGGTAPQGCYLFLLGPSLASAPAKSVTMGQLAAHEPTAIQNPGYVRKKITFNAPVLDPVSGDYYAATPVTAWTKEERSFAVWSMPVAWIGVVCGANEQAGVVNDVNGKVVSLAQISPARPVGANDTVSASYKVFQR